MTRWKAFVALIGVMLLTACGSSKDIAYLQSAEQRMQTESLALQDARIKPKDIITVIIQSSNPKAVAAFNGIYWSPTTETSAAYQQAKQFIVDNEGKVDLPVVGLISLGDMTLREAEAKVKATLDSYIKDLSSVNIKIINFRFSVLGEVKNPGSFIAENTKVSIFEALARAGDATVYGKVREVKLLREESDGSKHIETLDLTDPKILSSPYYYLQQGDVIYVIPNNAKASSGSVSSGTTIWISVASMAFALANVIISLVKK